MTYSMTSKNFQVRVLCLMAACGDEVKFRSNLGYSAVACKSFDLLILLLLSRIHVRRSTQVLPRHWAIQLYSRLSHWNYPLGLAISGIDQTFVL